MTRDDCYPADDLEFASDDDLREWISDLIHDRDEGSGELIEDYRRELRSRVRERGMGL